MLSTVWIPQRSSQNYIEKRRGRKETEVARGIKGGIKRERQIQPVISSLSVLHSLEHTKRFTELGREEKGARRRQRRPGGEKGDPNWKRAIRPVISLPSKNGY